MAGGHSDASRAALVLGVAGLLRPARRFLPSCLRPNSRTQAEDLEASIFGRLGDPDVFDDPHSGTLLVADLPPSSLIFAGSHRMILSKPNREI